MMGQTFEMRSREGGGGRGKVNSKGDETRRI